MVRLREAVPAEPHLRRRWWGGVGLVAAGGALVAGGAIAIASQTYQIQSSTGGSGSLGPGPVLLTFAYVGPSASVLAFWIALGLVPLLAIFVSRAALPAWALSIFLAFLVGSYALFGLLFTPLPTALFALCCLVLLGASLNCVGSLLLRRTKGRWWMYDLAIARPVPPSATRVLVPRRSRSR
jgi:hypothetical protein